MPMRFEVRTGQKKRVRELMELGLPVFIGSESCPHLLPAAGELAGLGVDGVVLPLTPQRHLADVLEVGRSALELGLRLVVNDAGVLWCLKDLNPRDVSAGRGLVHGIEACPWVDDLLRGESRRVRESLLQTTFDYSRNQRLFAGLGVTRIEIDNLPHALSRQRQLDVAVHADYVMVAYTMSCHTARHLDLQPPACLKDCGRLYSLELVDTFSMKNGMPVFDEPDQRVKQIYPTLHVLGNGVFSRTDAPIPDGFEVVVNADFYGDGDVAGVIERLDGGGTGSR